MGCGEEMRGWIYKGGEKKGVFVAEGVPWVYVFVFWDFRGLGLFGVVYFGDDN